MRYWLRVNGVTEIPLESDLDSTEKVLRQLVSYRDVRAPWVTFRDQFSHISFLEPVFIDLHNVATIEVRVADS